MGDLVRKTPHSEVTATLEKMDSLGISREDLARIRADKWLALKVADVIHGRTGETFRITVDYHQSLMQMVELGHYDRVGPDIKSTLFPIEFGDEVELEVRLIRLTWGRSGEGSLSWLGEHGFRIATIPELLAFGAAYPERQKVFSIVTFVTIETDVKDCYGMDHSKGLVRVFLGGRELKDGRSLLMGWSITAFLMPSDYLLAVRK